MRDFDQYNSLKASVMSGGVNHIDTGHTFRKGKSERTVGVAVRTLIEKYGFSRDELFINSK